jgi:DNA-binding response OmpR family regulator
VTPCLSPLETEDGTLVSSAIRDITDRKRAEDKFRGLLNLPKLGGLQVLHRIRAEERMRRLPVVILSSSREDRDLFGGYNEGANSCIVKPVDFVQLPRRSSRLVCTGLC